MRVPIWTAALVLGVLILAACGGSSGGGRDSGNTGDSNGSAKVTPSCRAIGEIQSYRYTISLKLQSPAFQRSNEATPADPLSAFSEALTALFADMELEGAFVAPDRSQAILRFQNEEVELRAIGGESWVRVGASWQEQTSPPEPGTLLTPQAVCEDLVADLASSLSNLEPREETVNGIETDHYRLDEADLSRLPELLGTGPQSDLPQRFAVDLWLAKEGRWPVRFQIAASDTDEEGQPTGLELRMEFRDINDPSIEIEPPLLSPIDT